MRSLACFVTGIALIGIVVPVQVILAQTKTTKQQHYCKKTDPHTKETPASVFCDRTIGDCNENTKYLYQPVCECINGGAEYPNSCIEWMGPAKYRTYPIVFVDEGYYATIIKLNAGEVVGCAVLSAIVSLTPAGVIGGIVSSIICGGVVLVFNLTINPCDYGHCKIDWTKETMGPNRLHCF